VRRFLALLALALFPATALAQPKSWEIASFHLDLSVDPAGTLDVRETIAVRFVGSWNGIYRWIPVVESKEGWGKKFLHLTVQEIRDDRGTMLKYETSRESDYKKFKIYIPGAINTTRTVVIAYRVSNAVRYFDDHDELYWNVTGNEWSVPIRRASAIITLPPGAAEGLRATAYTGPYGARGQDYRLAITNNVVELGTTRGLGYKEGLTVAVGWPKGVVAGPSAAARAWALLLEYAIFLLPVIVFFGYFLVWYRVGRDPGLTKSIMPRYEPPGDLRPSELGAVVDGRVDQRDTSALLVDLAVRGFLKIEETKESGWLFDSTSYTFHRKKTPSEWSGLVPFERQMLDGLFSGGKSSVGLNSLKNHFYRDLEKIRKQVFASLKARLLPLQAGSSPRPVQHRLDLRVWRERRGGDRQRRGAGSQSALRQRRGGAGNHRGVCLQPDHAGVDRGGRPGETRCARLRRVSGPRRAGSAEARHARDL